MNVHIVPDNKFFWELISYIKANKLCENNLFVVKINGDAVRYFPSYENMLVLKEDYQILNEIVLNECVEKIVVHNLSPDILRFLSKNLKKRKKSIYWLSWGSDFLAYAGNKKHILDKNLVSNDKGINRLNYSGLKLLLKDTFVYDAISFVRKFRNGRQLVVFDYYCVWNPFEFNLIEKIPFQNMEYRYFAYFSYSEIKYNKNSEAIRRKIGKKIKILVGHCGYDINNHISAFEIIKNSKIINGDVEIYAHLAYGDKNYIHYVRKLGVKFFGDKFIAVDEFMAQDQYVEFLRDMDMVYMNNVMVGGVANVATILKIGNCLIMRKENEFYKMLRDKNAKIFLPEDVFNAIEDGSCIWLTEDEKNENIEIIDEIFDFEKVKTGYDLIVR